MLLTGLDAVGSVRSGQPSAGVARLAILPRKTHLTQPFFLQQVRHAVPRLVDIALQDLEYLVNVGHLAASLLESEQGKARCCCSCISALKCGTCSLDLAFAPITSASDARVAGDSQNYRQEQQLRQTLLRA